MSVPLIAVENLHVEVEGKQILHGIDMEMGHNEIHILFGPNGSGKSTLVNTIMGLPLYKVTTGRILFEGQDITELPMEERARLGVGIAYQRPPVIRGLKLGKMLSVLSHGKSAKEIRKLAEELKMADFLDRDLNLGFSGGESKRAEILQLLLQQPKVIFLDEPESGVDLENVQLLGAKISELIGRTDHERRAREQSERSALIISHTGNILEYLHADKGHVMFNGQMLCSANPLEILDSVKDTGYRRCADCMQERGLPVTIYKN